MIKTIQSYLQMMKVFALQGHLPVWRQCYEMLVIYLKCQIGPGYYLVGRFGRRDIPFEDKLNYYNAKGYKKRIYELNRPSFRKLSQHKVAEAAMLNYFSVPTPESLGFYHPETGQNCRGIPLKNGVDLVHLLEMQNVNRFVVKPCQGFGGTGVCVAELLPDGYFRLLGQTELFSTDSFVDQFMDSGDGYFIQKYFQQHRELAEINPSSVNTVRMLVFAPKGKEPVCIGAFLRMGRAGTSVDNGSAGGLLANVDLKTGEVGSGYFFKPSVELYDTHPDSGIKIKGQFLPFWDEAKELSIKALACFFKTRFVGLDIAFGPDGPVVIELNVEPDYGDFAVLSLPSKKALSD
jgi:hypothetical protein